MKRIPVAAAVTLILVGAAFPTSRETSPVKCPPYTPVLYPDAPEPAFVLDGAAVERAALEQVERSTIESIEIVCAIELHQIFGVKAQRSGVVVFTKPGPQAVLQAALDTIASLQEKHRAGTGAFAKTLTDLGWNDPSDLLTIELEVSEDGAQWSAAGRHRYLLSESSRLWISGRAQGR